MDVDGQTVMLGLHPRPLPLLTLLRIEVAREWHPMRCVIPKQQVEEGHRMHLRIVVIGKGPGEWEVPASVVLVRREAGLDLAAWWNC